MDMVLALTESWSSALLTLNPVLLLSLYISATQRCAAGDRKPGFRVPKTMCTINRCCVE